MIESLQTHYGFTTMPFGASIPVQALHAHPGHREAVARIGWCVDQHQLGVVTGEVGAGKTVAVRAGLARLEASRHQVIYIADPTVGMRGIHSQIVTALGGTPAFYSGVLAHQTASLLAGELDERARLPVVVIDEAHLLANTDLESLRMLTNSGLDTGSYFALLLIGQPTLRRRLKLAVLAALDQRILCTQPRCGRLPGVFRLLQARACTYHCEALTLGDTVERLRLASNSGHPR